MADEDTRRTALAAAFTEAEKSEETPAPTPPAVEEKPATETQVEQKPEGDAYQKEAEAASRPADTKTPVQQELNLGDKPPVTEISAPVSWKPEEKAHWAKVPPEVRAVIARRELETQRALSTSAQARKFTDEFSRVVSPYAHLIRAQNSTPIQAVDNLMRTAAGLTVGTAQQKAAIVAEIIGNYGIDIQTLDAVLSSAPPPQNAGQASLPPQFAQALQPVYQFMEQIQSGRQTYEQRMQQKAAEDIQTFGADKPYFEEVREDMADLMEVAAKRGRSLSLEDAYKAAIGANPAYASAIQAQVDTSTAASILAKAKKAASSVSGAPTAASLAPKTPSNRREAIEQAWNSGN